MTTLRTISRRVMFAGGTALLVISLLAGYAQVVIISDTGFADHAAAALNHDDVRSALSQVIVTKLVTNAPPRVQSAQPVLEQAVATVAGTDAFQRVFRRAVLRTHHAMLSEHNNQVVINLSGQAASALSIVAIVDPKLASSLQRAQARLSRIGQSNGLLPVIRLLNRVHMLTFLAPLASALFFLLAIALAVDRRRSLRHVGIAIAVSAAMIWLLLVLVEFVGPLFLSGPFGQAFPGLADAYLSDLRRWCLVLAVAGLALVAIANTSGRPLDLPALARRSRDWVSMDGSSPRALGLLGLAAAAIGLLLVFQPLAVFRLLVLVVGAAAVYFGVFEVIRLSTPSAVALTGRSQAIADGSVGAGRWSAVAVVTVAVAVLWARNIWLV